jgi:hypothetical protein
MRWQGLQYSVGEKSNESRRQRLKTSNKKNKIIMKITIFKTSILRFPFTVLLIAAAMAGCSKDEKEIIKHDVVISFGFDDFETIMPEKVSAAAAPEDVGQVILESDGEHVHGLSSTIIIGVVLKPAFEASDKTTGRGAIKGMSLISKADSLWMAGKGYTIEDLRHTYSE